MTVASAFEFELPQELNATHPPERRGVRRDRVRMMNLDKETGNVKHKRFDELSDCLLPGDLVILNNSRTLPAILRATLKRNDVPLSVKIEVRLARRIDDARWEALIVADSRWTNLYIHREYPLQLVDGIITGFHEPKASHLDMLTAFIREDILFAAYHQAIKQKYLWHEFGDMNLIL